MRNGFRIGPQTGALEDGVLDRRDDSDVLVADDETPAEEVADATQLGPDFVLGSPRGRVNVLELLGLVPLLLSLSDVARRLQVCERSIYNRIRDDPRFPRRRRVGSKAMFLSTEVDHYIRTLGDDPGDGRAA